MDVEQAQFLHWGRPLPIFGHDLGAGSASFTTTMRSWTPSALMGSWFYSREEYCAQTAITND